MSRLEGTPRWQEAGGWSPLTIEMTKTNSQLLTAECRQLMLESDKASKKMQKDTSKRLEQRIQDIQFMRGELERKLEEIIVETDALVVFKTRVERALDACTEPLRVTILCQEERMKQAPIECVHDEVEKELLKEKEVIEGVVSLLQRVLEQIIEQIRLNRSAKYHLEKDLKDKFQAQCIDDSCTLMANHSLNHDQMPEEIKILLPSVEIGPDEWETFSDVNMAKAERERTNSLSLRALVDSLLEQTAEDMQMQLQSTASAIQFKIHETRAAKGQMEDQLAKILSELASQQINMEALNMTIAEMENPLKVAQARLSARGQRPAAEQCHDPVQTHLLFEVQELTAHINKMREAVSRSEMEQRSLTRCQLDLQESIEIKARALYIDEVLCTQLREPIIIHKF
ncbi:tektin-1 [Lampris incognitus]|uniref:tektin-1 n=1 Tax=Lampris incognitus TaxID=2546036 RepID=UPI0024B4BC9F|nr:tektin-1 [Lampris incognitus]